MGDALKPAQGPGAAPRGRCWPLPLALTVAATALLWDPCTPTYGSLKGALLPLGALATALAAWARVQRGATWHLHGALLALLGLACWAGTSLWWAPSLVGGLSALAPALAAVVLVVAGRVLLRGAAGARTLAVAVAATGLGAAVVALAEHAADAPAVTGTLGNANHLAAYMAASLPALVWIGLTAGRSSVSPPSVGRILAVSALALPGLAAMAVSGCRSAWLAAGAGGLTALALARPTRRQRAVALGLALLVCGAGGAAAARGPAPWRQALQGRLYLARISLSLWRAHPVTGHGVGGYALRFPEAQARRLADRSGERARWTHARTAHCEPLQGLVELGLVGGLLLLGVTLGLLVAMVGRRGPPQPRRVVAAAGLVALGVAGLAEGTLHSPALLTLAAAWVALLWEPGARRGALSRSGWVAVALVAATAFLSVAAARQYAADRLVIRAQQTADPGHRVALLRRAARLAPDGGRARLYLGLALTDQARPAAAAHELRRSALDFPNLGTTLALGNTHMARGAWAEAAAAYTRAAWLHPRYAAAHHNLGLALRRLGRRQAARASLARARRLRPGQWLEPWRIRALRRAHRSTPLQSVRGPRPYRALLARASQAPLFSSDSRRARRSLRSRGRGSVW